MSIIIAICDDELTQAEYLKQIVGKWAKLHNHVVEMLYFPSAEAFLFAYGEQQRFDILLLDIQMGGINGMELAKAIRKDDDTLQIIFITGYPDFAADSYDVSALHYLMKPVKEDKLFEVLDKAQQKLHQTDKPLLLTINGETHRIPLADIHYIEAQGHYIIIKTLHQEYKTKMNLSEIQGSLGDGFFRCQRSFIVNLRYVRTISRTTIELDDSTTLPLSRDLYEAANQAIINFFP